MVLTHLVRYRLTVVVTLLAVVAVGTPIAHGASAQGSTATSPSLVEVLPILRSPGAVAITGQNFTPGGAVFVALYDRWGVEAYEPRWVVATKDVHGTDGSQDPARGFTRGGAIEAAFGMAHTVYGPNGSQDPALGFDRIGADQRVGIDSEAVYGPDGSQDPARGYVLAGASDATAGELFGDAVMVRAYDARTGTWSNVLDVDLGC